MEDYKEHPKVLIEEWFPFEDVGIECQRERTGKFIPLNRLHVWWARRPLICSRAAIIGSVLPPDKKDEFYEIINIDRDLKEKIKKWQNLKLKGKVAKGISTSRAYKKNLKMTEILDFAQVLKKFWMSEKLSILDPMAGGGSIPFEALRYGFNVITSDLNPIATVLLNATINIPKIFGKKLIPKIQKYSDIILKNASKILKFFPKTIEEEFDAFIWARTVRCPDPKCNLIIPLSPNWYLSRKDGIILQIIPPKSFSETKCKFKIIKNMTTTQIKANTPTISKGIGICPRCNNSILSEYIKNEAQSQRLGHQLISIVYKELVGKKKTKRTYRTPNNKDLKAIKEAEDFLTANIEKWIVKGIIPEEKINKGQKTRELLNKGIDKWYKIFNTRQLVTTLVLFEELLNLKDQLLKNPDNSYEEVKAIITYLHIAFDKIIDYNSIQTRWHSGRSVIANTFDRHDFGFKWSYAEMDVVRKGYKWAIKHVLGVYNELMELINNGDENIAQIFCKPAQKLDNLQDNSVNAIIVDPPYYDNVMYAELSDFFYVWMKRSLGEFYPDIFNSDLTDKDNEAVANPSRFEGLGGSKARLAKQDYESKMEMVFKEMYRVLQINGVLTIMFTHKSTEAWDTLAMSLMEAGFEITASWPVHTEASSSLHIAKKNAVKTTILLICRKRVNNQDEMWWEDDVLPSLKRVIMNKVKEFRKLGIDGVDLFISCFGPALKEFSKYYPVRNIAGDLVRAEEAIEATRKVVIDITLQDITKGESYNIDQVSKFYLTAWHFFKARIFPFDEARRLALSIGINIDELKTNYKLLDKKSGDVIILYPKEREKNGTINIDNPNDNGILINAVHTAILAYEEGGQKLYNNVVEKLRRNTDKSFRLYMETLFNILPDVKDLAKNLPEKKILGEILMTTDKKITPKGGKITDFLDK